MTTRPRGCLRMPGKTPGDHPQRHFAGQQHRLRRILRDRRGAEGPQREPQGPWPPDLLVSGTCVGASIDTGHPLSFNAEFNVPTCRSSAVFVRILGVLIIISVGPLSDHWQSEQGPGARCSADRRTCFCWDVVAIAGAAPLVSGVCTRQDSGSGSHGPWILTRDRCRCHEGQLLFSSRLPGVSG